jgi:hypothetical protein
MDCFAGRPLNFLMADSTPSHGQQRVVLLSKAARARVLHGVNLSDLSHPYTV